MISIDMFGANAAPKIPKARKAPKPRPNPARIAALQLEATALYASRREATQILSELQHPYDVLEANFYAAHNNLVMAWVGNDLSPEARTRRKPLYDARMAAGVAWNPVKKTYRDAEAWRRTIDKSLQIINEELDQ